MNLVELVRNCEDRGKPRLTDVDPSALIQHADGIVIVIRRIPVHLYHETAAILTTLNKQSRAPVGFELHTTQSQIEDLKELYILASGGSYAVRRGREYESTLVAGTFNYKWFRRIKQYQPIPDSY
jgi:hypothetical protein